MAKANVMNSLKIFFLYSKTDKRVAEILMHYLIPLVKMKRVDIYDGSDVISGKDWELDTKERFNQSDIFIALISPDFVASDFCYQDDLKALIERHNNKRAIILPVLVKLTPFWKELVTGEFDYLPIDGKPISQSKNEEETLFDIMKHIKKVIKKLLGKEEKNLEEI
ncbi:toll/interleukin-1 receptor domain-containing protein [bacterium]|nr:toll/interleukin-1 receptor domain-containing protein [bacterium]